MSGISYAPAKVGQTSLRVRQSTVTQFLHHPDQDDKLVVAHTEDFTGLIDLNTAMRNEGMHGTKDMRLVAQIPGILIEQYCQLNNVSWAEFFADPKHIKRMLNDPDLAAFRVAPGKV